MEQMAALDSVLIVSKSNITFTSSLNAMLLDEMHEFGAKCWIRLEGTTQLACDGI
jgi:hypothetical protein